MKQLLRKQQVRQIYGKGNTQFHEDIKKGLFIRPIVIGPRAVAFPSDEVERVINARIAGKTEAEVKALVDSLHEARKCLA